MAATRLGVFSAFSSGHGREEPKHRMCGEGALSDGRAPWQRPLSRDRVVVRPLLMFGFTAFESIFISIYQ